MEELAQFPVGFIIALSGVLIPGPLLAYVIVKTGQSGRSTGFFAAAGHMMVELVFLALIAAGLGVVMASFYFQVGLGIFGGAILLVLGVFAIIRLVGGYRGEGIVVGRYHPVIGGIFFSTVLNPSVPIWWVTVGFATLMEAYVLASTAGVVMWLLGHFTADFLWFSGVSVAVAKGRKFIGTRGHRVLLLFCAVVLIVIGFYFLVKYGFALTRVST
ncbi:MAG: LysE family transporter [Candidatus Hadarchaeales archaeon]